MYCCVCEEERDIPNDLWPAASKQASLKHCLGPSLSLSSFSMHTAGSRHRRRRCCRGGPPPNQPRLLSLSVPSGNTQLDGHINCLHYHYCHRRADDADAHAAAAAEAVAALNVVVVGVLSMSLLLLCLRPVCIVVVVGSRNEQQLSHTAGRPCHGERSLAGFVAVSAKQGMWSRGERERDALSLCISDSNIAEARAAQKHTVCAGERERPSTIHSLFGYTRLHARVLRSWEEGSLLSIPLLKIEDRIGKRVLWIDGLAGRGVVLLERKRVPCMV